MNCCCRERRLAGHWGLGFQQRGAELCPIKRLSHCTRVAQRSSSAGKCTHSFSPKSSSGSKNATYRRTDQKRCERDAWFPQVINFTQVKKAGVKL